MTQRPAPLAALAFLVVLGASGCAASPASQQLPASQPSSASSGTSHHHAIGTIKHLLTLGGYLDGLAVDRGVLWATDLDGNRVVRVDPVSAKPLGDVSVPGGPLAVLAAGGAIWVASYHASTVTRVDPESGAKTAVVATRSKAPCGLAAAGNRLWIFDQSDGTGLLVDTHTAKILRRSSTAAHSGFATWAFGSVWVPDFAGTSNSIVRVNPTTGATLDTIRTGTSPISVARGAGSLWVANANGTTVTRLDPSTGRVQAQITIPGGGPVAVLVTQHQAWVTSYSAQALYRVDLTTNKVDGRLALPGPAENMVVAAGLIWVTMSNGQLAAVEVARSA